MSVRARVAIALAIVALPALLAAIAITWTARRDAMLEAVVAGTIDRMESGGREHCEADPSRFGRGRHGGPRLLPYTASLEPGSPRVPPMRRELREGLAGGEELASVHRERGHAVAIRMPWAEGPCAVIVVEHRDRGPRGPGIARDLALALGALVLAAIVAWIALGAPLRRLARLAESVRRSKAEDLSVPAGIEGPDEIGDVARALSEAGARVRAHVATLEARERALTEYVDGTTHDLAIPLTVLAARLADAETAARSGKPIDRALLAGAIAETEYVAQLVANMGAAARLEGIDRTERGEVDLRAIVDRVVARHAVVARHHATTLEGAVPERAVIAIGDDILLERLLSNLVHNAIRHRSEGEAASHVAVVLAREGDRFVLTVADDHAAVDDALVERLSRGDDVGDRRRARGRGLGLRIVRRIAALHGLELAFRRGAEGGLEVRVSGPLAG